MPRGRYTTVKIPQELAEILDSFSGTWGYRSRAEMVDEAIRLFIVRMNQVKQTDGRRR